MFDRPWKTLVYSLPLMFALIALIVSCRQTSTTEKIEVVGAMRLVEYYRDFGSEADGTWKGRMVQIAVAKGFKIVGNEIHLVGGLPNAPPVMILQCTIPPVDNSRAVDVTGRCKGRFVDGRNRGQGIDFVAVIGECVVVVK